MFRKVVGDRDRLVQSLCKNSKKVVGKNLKVGLYERVSLMFFDNSKK